MRNSNRLTLSKLNSLLETVQFFLRFDLPQHSSRDPLRTALHARQSGRWLVQPLVQTEKETSHCARICKIRWRCSIYAEVNGDYDYLRGEILCSVGSGGGGGGGRLVPNCVIMQLKYQRVNVKRSLAAPGRTRVSSRLSRDTWAWVQKGAAAVLHKSECVMSSLFAQEEACSPVITHYAKNISFCKMKIPRLCLTLPTTVKRVSVSNVGMWATDYHCTCFFPFFNNFFFRSQVKLFLDYNENF